MEIKIHYETDKFSFDALIESKNLLTHSVMTDYSHKEDFQKYLRQLCIHLAEELEKIGPKIA
jgi:hypothetical protein